MTTKPPSIPRGKKRIMITVEKKALGELRAVLAELGFPKQYLSHLLNESIKAQVVGFRKFAELKRQGGKLDAGTFTSWLLGTSIELDEQERQEELRLKLGRSHPAVKS